MSEPAEVDRSPPSSDTETLETALIESRRTFDKSVARLEDIDDKAMRSVRTAVLLAGLVASAISLGGPESVSQVGLLPVLTGAAGVVSLGASTVVGIGVYAATEYPFGVQSPHRPSVAGSERTYDAWLLALLDTYDTWIDELHIETTRTIGYLEFVQVTLGIAVVSLLLSSGMIVLHASYGTKPLVTLVVALLAGVLVTTRNKFVSRRLK